MSANGSLAARPHPARAGKQRRSRRQNRKYRRGGSSCWQVPLGRYLRGDRRRDRHYRLERAGEPIHPRFPVSQGLCGRAVRSRSTVVVGEVAKHPAYLTTFGSTRSEIVVPVVQPATGTVLGVIDVESERLDAFTGDARVCLEACASAFTALLWPPLAPGGLSPTPSATD